MFPTACKPLDLLLGGGVMPRIVTQVYGPASSGKTNICLQTLHNAVKSGKRACFVDTEGSFVRNRLEQICGTNLKRVLENTFLFEPHEFSEQSLAIEKACATPADLLIVDSMTALYRVEMTDERARDTNKELGRQLALLTRFSRENDAPVIITNQVYADIDNNLTAAVGGDIMKYACKIIVELEKQENGVRRAILRKHAFKKEGATALFQITGRGINECE